MYNVLHYMLCKGQLRK